MSRYIEHIAEKIVGAKVLRIETNPSHDYVQFVTDKGNFTFSVDGDCCSESWIEHLTNTEALIGQVITDVEDIEMGQLDNAKEKPRTDTYYDCLQQYRTKISTVKGTCELEYRNNSNGYYGGNLCMAGEKEGLEETGDF